MNVITTTRKFGRTIKNMTRLRTIVGVFAKHGFHNIAERIQLGKFIIERLNSDSDLEQMTVSERLRRAFEELGPTFVKLGQLLSSRPDLIPEELIKELAKLQDRVQPLAFEHIENILKSELKEDLKNKIKYIDPNPLGSASIGQVHRAILDDDSVAVLKVQRPGILQIVQDDLNVLFFLAETIEKYIPESKSYSPVKIAEEFFKKLELETNFLVEANNIKKMSSVLEKTVNLQAIKIPKVYDLFSTEKVLVLEYFAGSPLSQIDFEKISTEAKNQLLKICFDFYTQTVFLHGFFHGDLHAGNLILLDEKNPTIGLIDFGVVGRLNLDTKKSIAQILLSLETEDYEKVAMTFADLSPYDESFDLKIYSRELRDLIAPYHGMKANDFNIGKLLMRSVNLSAKHGLTIPSELILFFKSMIFIESIGRKINANFDFLTYSLAYAQSMLKTQALQQQTQTDLIDLISDSRALIQMLPRQLHQQLKKINSPSYQLKVHNADLPLLNKSIHRLGTLTFLAILLGFLTLSLAIFLK